MMGIAPEIYNHMSQPHQAAMPTTQALFGQPPTYRPMMGGRHIPNIGDFGGSESFPRRTHQRGGGGGGAHGQQQPQQQDHQSQLSRDVRPFDDCLSGYYPIFLQYPSVDSVFPSTKKFDPSSFLFDLRAPILNINSTQQKCCLLF